MDYVGKMHDFYSVIDNAIVSFGYSRGIGILLIHGGNGYRFGDIFLSPTPKTWNT